MLVRGNVTHLARSMLFSHHLPDPIASNGFLLGADGKQAYLHSSHASNGTNTWGQAAYVAAGRQVIVNIDPQTNATVSASAVCQAALARKEAYAQELLGIAQREKIGGFITDWEDASGNNMTCFNALFAYVSSVIRPKGLQMSMSMDNSNHQGPMDLNSTEPWSAEWDWKGAVDWGSALVNMGTYPGSWSKGLSFPAAQYVESFPCPSYPKKTCGLKGQVLDMLAHKVDPNDQLSPGLWPGPCSADGLSTPNGWTKEALVSFLSFLDDKGVRSVTLWFNNALQQFKDGYTCPWFMPALLDWAQKQ